MEGDAAEVFRGERHRLFGRAYRLLVGPHGWLGDGSLASGERSGLLPARASAERPSADLVMPVHGL